MKWLALHVGGQKFGVFVVSRKHPKLAGAHGAYEPSLCRIYIASDLEEGAREDTLFHELDHVVNEVSGAAYILEGAVKPSQFEAVDEKIVRARTPIWHRLLKDLGFRFPRGLNQ